MRARTAIWIAGSLAAAGYCASRPGVARIVYINADRSIGTVVEQATREEGAAVSAILIPASAAAVDTARGEAPDVAYAEAAVTTQGVVAVVGHPSSRASLLAAPIYAEAGVPFIAPTATSARLRHAGPWIFQLAPDDEAEGAFIANFALDSLPTRRISVIYLAADEYGIGLRDGIVSALAARGVTPVDEVGVLEDSDFERRVAASLRGHVPDAVVIAARTPEAVAIARAIRARLPRVPLILADGVENGAFVRGTGARLGPAYAVVWWRPDSADPASRAFVARFSRAAGRPPRQQEAMYYDALMVAAQAVRAVGARRGAIRRYLSELGVTRPPYRGVTGLISFARGRPTNLVMLRLGGTSAVSAITR